MGCLLILFHHVLWFYLKTKSEAKLNFIIIAILSLTMDEVNSIVQKTIAVHMGKEIKEVRRHWVKVPNFTYEVVH